MLESFDHRSLKLERLDTGDYTPEEYALWQKEARLINRFLGDSSALRLEIGGELAALGDRPISILDAGAGSGELLRTVRSSLSGKKAQLIGAELNADAARSIGDRHHENPIFAVQCDALQLPFGDDSFDIAISSLFLHHLTDEQAVTLIREMARVARRKFVIIDLHRHAAAYYLYRILGPMALQKFTIEDGSLSILKSFRPSEMLSLAQKAGVRNASVKKRFAYRLVLTGSKRDSPLNG